MSFTFAPKSKNKMTDNKISTLANLYFSSYHHRMNQLEEKESPDSIIHLQRMTADKAMQEPAYFGEKFDFAKINIPPKLRVSQPGDEYEQEADNVADQVMGIRTPSDLIASKKTANEEIIHRKRAACDAEEMEEDENMNINRKISTPFAFEENDGIANEINIILFAGNGSELDSFTKQFMESRFGYDFNNVRIHTDERAARSARSINALAYTIGNDIVFGEDQYAPMTQEGQRLLAHELTHVVQQRQHSSSEDRIILHSEESAENDANISASNVFNKTPLISLHASSYPKGLYRQQTSSGSPSNDMTRVTFEEIMLRRFGVSRIVTGSMQEQILRLTPHGGAPLGGILLPNWQQWDPGPSSPVYSWIIESFEDFSMSIGGVPLVQEIAFFNMNYEIGASGVGIPQPYVGASFGAGHLTVFSALTTSDKALPIIRSNLQGNYPRSTAVVTGIPGQSPGAPMPLPSQKHSAQRMIAHELGHGLAEAALGPNPTIALDPTMMTDYRREIGWTPGIAPELFDIGVPGVATDLAAGRTPSASNQITENNWNSPRWREQPISHYSVVGGPAEDFAEAVMAFIYEPTLLSTRSPHRFNFLNSRKDRWLPRLLRLPQIGDFPELLSVERLA